MLLISNIMLSYSELSAQEPDKQNLLGKSAYRMAFVFGVVLNVSRDIRLI